MHQMLQSPTALNPITQNWELVLQNILEHAESPRLAAGKDQFGVCLHAAANASALATKSGGWILNLHDKGIANLSATTAGPVYWVALARPGAIAGALAEDTQGAWWCSHHELALHTPSGFVVMDLGPQWAEAPANLRLDVAAAILMAGLLGLSTEDILLWAQDNWY